MEQLQTRDHLGKLNPWRMLLHLVLLALGLSLTMTEAFAQRAAEPDALANSDAIPLACTVTINGNIQSTDPVQIGRVVDLVSSSSCGVARGYPGTFDTIPRHYDAHTFVNPNPNTTCVTVDLAPLSLALVQSAAYLGSYNPADISQNYLGDIGPLPSLLGGSYSVSVPANATFVIVVTELVPNVSIGPYRLRVISEPACQVTATPTSTSSIPGTQTSIAATQTAAAATESAVAGSATAAAQSATATGTATAPASATTSGTGTSTGTAAVSHTATPASTTTPCAIQGSLTAGDALQLGRPLTLLDASSCNNPRGYPGTFDVLPRHYDSYTYQNANNSPVCVTVDIDNSCLSGILLQSAAYLGNFDPNSIGANYLGDVGPGILNNSSYSFTVPANSQYVVVVSEFLPLTLCGSYTLRVSTGSGGVCPIGGGSPTVTTTTTATSTGGSATATATSSSGTTTPAASATAGAGGTQTAIASLTSGAATQTALASQTAGGETQTATAQSTATSTASSGSATSTAASGSVTATAGSATSTAGTATASPTHCPIDFVDVPPDHFFYTYIRCLVCRGIVNGYPCGGPTEPCNSENQPYFRWGSNVTRAQTAKMASNSAGFNDVIPAGQQTFEDVPSGSSFYSFVERLAMRGYIDGYPCGSSGEPCGPGNRKYFRPQVNITRGQISKVVSNSAGFVEDIPLTQQTYEDVPQADTFWLWVERLSDRGVMQGYECGSPLGGPCVPPHNRSYFYAYNAATRGQTAKIVSNTFFPDCYTPRP